MSNIDVIIDTMPLPRPATHVWSPQDQVLIVSTHATPEQAQQAWAEVTDQPWPGLPEQRRSA